MEKTKSCGWCGTENPEDLTTCAHCGDNFTTGPLKGLFKDFAQAEESQRKFVDSMYPHYFKDCPYDKIDVYRVLQLWGVSDPCLQHALKKILCAGGRGHKDAAKDVSEAIASLERWQQMRDEERIGK